MTRCGRGKLAWAVINSEGQFGERCPERSFRVGLDTEFVVAASEVLDEPVAGTDHAGGAEPFEPPGW